MIRYLNSKLYIYGASHKSRGVDHEWSTRRPRKLDQLFIDAPRCEMQRGQMQKGQIQKGRYVMFRSMFRVLVLLLAWTVSAEAAGVRFLPGDTAVGPAIGTQTAPAIAEGNGSFLAVWQDLRTSPFIGPPFFTEGRGFDIYMQRLDVNGAPLDSAPTLIAQRFGDQTAPQIAWNGENWLVAWGGPNSTLFNHRIQAVRIAPDGTVLDDPAIAVHNSGDKSNFALTANGTEWLVTAHGVHSGENDFRGVRISGSGVVLNLGGTQLLAATSSLYPFDVVSAQGEYLFVWGNSSTAPRGLRFNANLDLIGGPFPVNSLNIASNGTGYFLTWLDRDASFDPVVLGQRLSVDGFPGPVVTLAGTGGGLALFNPAQLDIGWDGGDWWASWLETTRGVVFSRMTPADVVLDFGGLPVDPAAPNRHAEEHAVAGWPGGGAQFLWSDNRAAGVGSQDIYSADVGFDAIPGPSAPVSISARGQISLDFAEGQDSLGNEQVLAVYLSEHSGVRKLVGQRLDAVGNVLDPEPFEIASGTGIGTPHVGFDGTRYMVVWPDGGQSWAKRVRPDGSLIDATPLAIMDSESPDVAGLNGTFLVVGTRPTISAHFFHPFSMRVDGATGLTLDPAPVLLGQYFARYPRVIAFDGRWLATWQRNVTHDNPNSSTYAAFVETNGTTAGEFGYGGGAGAPDLATSGDRVLFVWRVHSAGSGHNDVVGRLMLADGTFVGAGFAISAAPSPLREFDPDVAWNGTEFVVAWTDERSEVIYFDNRTEVFAARVMPDGTVLDPAGFAVGDLAEQEIHPSVASIGGRTIIAHSSFRDDPALQAYRIGYQVFGNTPVGNRWPVAVVSATPASGVVALPVSFSATGSSDPDGTIASYAWNFGDGSAGTGASPSQTYTVAGEYVAELTVTDNQGATTSNTARIIVAPINQPPVAVASADRLSGSAPLSIEYQAAGSYDPDDGIAQFFWEFGDGGTYFGGTAYHTYSVAGTFITTLTITDQSGATADATLTITVDAPNQPPMAVAGATPLFGDSPLSVDFSAAGSGDADGTISGYSWNFGDGDVSTETNPTHVYAVGGLYDAVLTVTDNEGASGTDMVSIDVAQGDITSVANADLATGPGAIAAGTFWDTQTDDGVYEELIEGESGGKPSKRRSQLSHTWTIPVAPGVSHSFHVDAYHTDSGENDNFAFAYSRDGSTFAPMLVVDATVPGGPLQSYTFPENVSGTLYVQVTDTDRTQGYRALDTLYVDEMFVVTSSSGGDTTPPAAPAGLVATAGDGSVSLDWPDNAEPDLAGYTVYRATTTGGPYAPLTGVLIAQSAYIDSAVTNGTTYYYVVTASDGSGNESVLSAEDSATPQATGGATTMHIATISVRGVNAGRGAKTGQATVTVLDNQGSPVASAAVTGNFTGGLVETGRSGTTGANGIAVITSAGSKKRLSFTFCVTGVTGGGLDYDPAANPATCATY